MVDDGLYEVYRTPDFAEDIYCAVSYVAEELGSPIAARTLLALWIRKRSLFEESARFAASSF